jgi:hypothetical protein
MAAVAMYMALCRHKLKRCSYTRKIQEVNVVSFIEGKFTESKSKRVTEMLVISQAYQLDIELITFVVVQYYVYK